MGWLGEALFLYQKDTISFKRHDHIVLCVAVGLWDCGTVGLWGCGTVGLRGCGTVGLWDCGTVGL